MYGFLDQVESKGKKTPNVIINATATSYFYFQSLF